jgi:hypothetical protein
MLAALRDQKQIDDQIKADLNDALKEFGQTFAAARKAA